MVVRKGWPNIWPRSRLNKPHESPSPVFISHDLSTPVTWRGEISTLLDGVVNVTDLLSLLGAWGVCRHGYYMSVCWHNLKVETHNLRIQHEKDLRELQADSVAKVARKHQIQQNPIKSSTSEATGDGGAKGMAEHLAAVATEQAA